MKKRHFFSVVFSLTVLFYWSILQLMFTSEQRLQILKWGGLTLFSLSLLPLLMHGLFFIVLFQYYIPLAIISYALYFTYLKIKQTDFHDEDVIKVLKTFFTKNK